MQRKQWNEQQQQQMNIFKKTNKKAEKKYDHIEIKWNELASDRDKSEAMNDRRANEWGMSLIDSQLITESERCKRSDVCMCCGQYLHVQT